MASRTLARSALRASRSLTTAARPAVRPLASAAFRQQNARFNSSDSKSSSSSSGSGGFPWAWIFGATALGGGYLVYANGAVTPDHKPTAADYQKVYNAIAEKLEEDDNYDDGSYGPVLLRLAWHASGTFDKETGTGGSNGATMRFAPESAHGANAGLVKARDFLEPIKAKFPWISYSDLWIIGGIAAIQEMQGPVVPFRPGRADRDMSACTPDGRLPDAAQGAKHVRDIFYRMGFNDQEIVALIGAHAVGRCHRDRSGYEGPWTFSPTVLTNDFYRLLLEEKWQWKKWSGPAQYEDKGSKSLMMLPADMAFIQDKAFKKHVEAYAKDNELFFRDFAAAVGKLFELGVPFKQDTEKIVFKATNA